MASLSGTDTALGGALLGGGGPLTALVGAAEHHQGLAVVVFSEEHRHGSEADPKWYPHPGGRLRTGPDRPRNQASEPCEES